MLQCRPASRCDISATRQEVLVEIRVEQIGRDLLVGPLELRVDRPIGNSDCDAIRLLDDILNW